MHIRWPVVIMTANFYAVRSSPVYARQFGWIKGRGAFRESDRVLFKPQALIHKENVDEKIIFAIVTLLFLAQ